MHTVHCLYSAATDQLVVRADGTTSDDLLELSDTLRVARSDHGVIAVQIDEFSVFTDYVILRNEVGRGLFDLITRLQAEWIDGVTHHDARKLVASR